MTSDRGHCYARVTYKCQKGKFVSEWSQHRAHDKPNGALQDAHGKIYSVDNPQDLLFNEKTGKARKEDGMGDFGRANAQIIQLDYSQFCRSIMLAQGEFSRFLTSTERERADILEKLNGTERFRRIGAKVGEHRREARAAKENAQTAFDALDSAMPNVEAVATDEALLKDFAEKEKTFKAKKAELEAKVNWRNSLNGAQERMNKAEGELARAKQDKQNFVENESRLARAEKARECALLYTKLEEYRKLQKADGDTLVQLQSDLPAATEKLQSTSEQKAFAEKAKLAAEQFIAENEALWNEIRKLDENLKNAQDLVATAKMRKERAIQLLSDAETELQNAKKDILAIEPKVKELKDTQAANAQDVNLRGEANS